MPFHGTTLFLLISSLPWGVKIKLLTSICCLNPTDQNGSAYFGALVGRVANRVADARFVLDGKVYHLYRNDGKNALHGTYTSESGDFKVSFACQRELLGAP